MLGNSFQLVVYQHLALLDEPSLLLYQLPSFGLLVFPVDLLQLCDSGACFFGVQSEDDSGLFERAYLDLDGDGRCVCVGGKRARKSAFSEGITP